MKIFYHSRFFKKYQKLPIKIKLSIEDKEKVFRRNPFDPLLRTHRLHGRLKGLWAFSLTAKYRIIFDFLGGDKVRFITIGTHDIYE